MKQITEINDSRLVKGLAHPLRIHILQALENRVASPSEIAAEIGAPLGNVSYHVRFLARVGLIELASTKPRRGAVEHYYRAVGRVRIADEAWAEMPEVVKNGMISAALEQIRRVIAAAASSGGFDHQDAHVSRRSLLLDDQGFAELAGAVKQLVDRSLEIERASAERVAASGHAEHEISAGLVSMLFEAADHQAAIVGKLKSRRTATA